jgi:hypothetical protein
MTVKNAATGGKEKDDMKKITYDQVVPMGVNYLGPIVTEEVEFVIEDKDVEEWLEQVDHEAQLNVKVVDLPENYVTPAEIREMAPLFAEQKYGKGRYTPAELEETVEDLGSCYILKIPHYVSGGPGYVGPVYIVIWDGGPGFHYVITRNTLTKGGAMEFAHFEGVGV